LPHGGHSDYLALGMRAAQLLRRRWAPYRADSASTLGLRDGTPHARERSVFL